jgi:hypothetical protein
MIMFDKISEEKKEEAIRYLFANIPEDCLREVLITFQKEGAMWCLSLHMNFGMYVRNLLREGGFNWGAIELDHLWVELIEEAAKRVQSMKANRK